ncbi:hypothetical protein O3M35_013224 [Rhynocoris fuscipes]|uniref:Uncharacterized protein n=1 Tax=Rhynocoris fuscipes TaxID=488301 RepID=A0AAW1CFE2_9HEMI
MAALEAISEISNDSLIKALKHFTPFTNDEYNDPRFKKSIQKLIGKQIDYETIHLLEMVDHLVDVMEAMKIGPEQLDHYRYGAINDELDNIYKLNLKDDLRGDESLGPIQGKRFNEKLEAVEKEIQDIGICWLEHYGDTLQRVIEICYEVLQLLTQLDKVSKKQKKLGKKIAEFLAYALAQKRSVSAYLYKESECSPSVTTNKEVFERIDALRIKLNTPLPIYFGNCPRSISEDSVESRCSPCWRKSRSKKKVKKMEEEYGDGDGDGDRRHQYGEESQKSIAELRKGMDDERDDQEDRTRLGSLRKENFRDIVGEESLKLAEDTRQKKDQGRFDLGSLRKEKLRDMAGEENLKSEDDSKQKKDQGRLDFGSMRNEKLRDMTGEECLKSGDDSKQKKSRDVTGEESLKSEGDSRQKKGQDRFDFGSLRKEKLGDITGEESFKSDDPRQKKSRDMTGGESLKSEDDSRQKKDQVSFAFGSLEKDKLRNMTGEESLELEVDSSQKKSRDMAGEESLKSGDTKQKKDQDRFDFGNLRKEKFRDMTGEESLELEVDSSQKKSRDMTVEETLKSEADSRQKKDQDRLDFGSLRKEELRVMTGEESLELEVDSSQKKSIDMTGEESLKSEGDSRQKKDQGRFDFGSLRKEKLRDMTDEESLELEVDSIQKKSRDKTGEESLKWEGDSRQKNDQDRFDFGSLRKEKLRDNTGEESLKSDDNSWQKKDQGRFDFGSLRKEKSRDTTSEDMLKSEDDYRQKKDQGRFQFGMKEKSGDTAGEETLKSEALKAEDDSRQEEVQESLVTLSPEIVEEIKEEKPKERKDELFSQVYRDSLKKGYKSRKDRESFIPLHSDKQKISKSRQKKDQGRFDFGSLRKEKLRDMTDEESLELEVDSSQKKSRDKTGEESLKWEGDSRQKNDQDRFDFGSLRKEKLRDNTGEESLKSDDNSWQKKDQGRFDFGSLRKEKSRDTTSEDMLKSEDDYRQKKDQGRFQFGMKEKSGDTAGEETLKSEGLKSEDDSRQHEVQGSLVTVSPEIVEEIKEGKPRERKDELFSQVYRDSLKKGYKSRKDRESFIPLHSDKQKISKSVWEPYLRSSWETIDDSIKKKGGKPSRNKRSRLSPWKTGNVFKNCKKKSKRQKGISTLDDIYRRELYGEKGKLSSTTKKWSKRNDRETTRIGDSTKSKNLWEKGKDNLEIGGSRMIVSERKSALSSLQKVDDSGKKKDKRKHGNGISKISSLMQGGSFKKEPDNFGEGISALSPPARLVNKGDEGKVKGGYYRANGKVAIDEGSSWETIYEESAEGNIPGLAGDGKSHGNSFKHKEKGGLRRDLLDKPEDSRQKKDKGKGRRKKPEVAAISGQQKNVDLDLDLASTEIEECEEKIIPELADDVKRKKGELKSQGKTFKGKDKGSSGRDLSGKVDDSKRTKIERKAGKTTKADLETDVTSSGMEESEKKVIPGLVDNSRREKGELKSQGKTFEGKDKGSSGTDLSEEVDDSKRTKTEGKAGKTRKGDESGVTSSGMEEFGKEVIPGLADDANRKNGELKYHGKTFKGKDKGSSETDLSAEVDGSKRTKIEGTAGKTRKADLEKDASPSGMEETGKGVNPGLTDDSRRKKGELKSQGKSFKGKDKGSSGTDLLGKVDHAKRTKIDRKAGKTRKGDESGVTSSGMEESGKEVIPGLTDDENGKNGELKSQGKTLRGKDKGGSGTDLSRKVDDYRKQKEEGKAGKKRKRDLESDVTSSGLKGSGKGVIPGLADDAKKKEGELKSQGKSFEGSFGTDLSGKVDDSRKQKDESDVTSSEMEESARDVIPGLADNSKRKKGKLKSQGKTFKGKDKESSGTDLSGKVDDSRKQKDKSGVISSGIEESGNEVIPGLADDSRRKKGKLKSQGKSFNGKDKESSGTDLSGKVDDSRKQKDESGVISSGIEESGKEVIPGLADDSRRKKGKLKSQGKTFKGKDKVSPGTDLSEEVDDSRKQKDESGVISSGMEESGKEVIPGLADDSIRSGEKKNGLKSLRETLKDNGSSGEDLPGKVDLSRSKDVIPDLNRNGDLLSGESGTSGLGKSDFEEQASASTFDTDVSYELVPIDGEPVPQSTDTPSTTADAGQDLKIGNTDFFLKVKDRQSDQRRPARVIKFRESAERDRYLERHRRREESHSSEDDEESNVDDDHNRPP